MARATGITNSETGILPVSTVSPGYEILGGFQNALAIALPVQRWAHGVQEPAREKHGCE